MAPKMIACKNTTVTTASDLPAMMPQTGSGVAPEPFERAVAAVERDRDGLAGERGRDHRQRHDDRNEGGGAVAGRTTRTAAA